MAAFPEWLYICESDFFFFFKFTLAAVFTIKFFFSYMRYAEMQPIKFPCLLRAELDARVCPREFI